MIVKGYTKSYLRNETEEWANVLDQYMLRPIEDRILVQEDPPKSKYDCSECDGVGHVGVVCKYCKGTRYDKGNEENGYCRDCTVGDSTSGVGRTLGFEPCPTCKGRGGVIITPDDTKKNATMGRVLAIGRMVKEYKVNTKVMYTNYTGSPFKFMDIDLRIMHEKDVLCEVKQLKKNVDSLTEGTYADLENTGTPHEND